MVEDSSEKNDSIAKLEERTCDTNQLLIHLEGKRVMRMWCEHEIFRTVDPFHSYSGCNMAQNGGTEYKVVQKHLIDI